MNLHSAFYFSRIASSIAVAFLIALVSCNNDPEPPALPQVNAISPTSGLINTPVTITGTNFSTVLGENKVTFNGKEAVVTTASATQLTTTVPLSAASGPVSVIVKDLATSNQPIFTVEYAIPEVSKTSPASGPINTQVIITGTNFSTLLAENKVTFNGKEAVVTIATDTQLTTTVPMLAETGPIVVTVKGKAATNQPAFTVVSIPVLTTSNVNTLTSLTAVGEGNVTSDGGSPITFRGLCWSANPTPTIDDNKTADETGTGAFTSAITGLTEGSVYYARAYATNSVGTAYGNEVTFTALVIGQIYKGGVLGYLLQPGDPGYYAGEAHGIIVSHYSSPAWHWSHEAITVTGTKTALGTGKANTDRIIRSQPSFPRTLAEFPDISAAQICFYVVQNGEYINWYLPSKDELNKLYINKDKLPEFTKDGRDYYWTSSEVSQNEAWIQSFKTGTQSTYYKTGEILFSPIRSF